jgi:hypothetical protein
MIDEGDRVEVLPLAGCNRVRRGIIGRRGTVDRIDVSGPYGTLPFINFRLDVLIWVQIDDDTRTWNFAPEEIRKLSLLELIAEAAA